MLFSNPLYVFFLSSVYLVYWGLSRRWQNRFLLLVSYFFYSCWNIKLLPLIVLCSLSAYLIAAQLVITVNERQRKQLLILGLAFNFVFLLLFKYYDFFVSSLIDLLAFLGLQANWQLLHLILPVGISFYTFQSASYIIDVYRGGIKPCESVTEFLLYIAFFPQLVAGPIERAATMLPQFARRRKFILQDARSGILLISYGILKKVLIADNLAIYVDRWYGDIDATSGWLLLIGTLLFSFQIYCDFSGYSDIAIGSGRLLGFHLSRNFYFPYFSTNPSVFWRRWHITLMSWLRDYIYIPLGGNRHGRVAAWGNVLLVFFISGLWHGARWNFIVWGLFNGIILLVYLALKQKVQWIGEKRGRICSFFGSLCTFLAICMSWVLFRVETLSDGVKVFAKFFVDFHPDISSLFPLLKPLLLLTGFVGLELLIYQLGEERLKAFLAGYRLYFVCLLAVIMTTLLGLFQHVPFIYFQF